MISILLPLLLLVVSAEARRGGGGGGGGGGDGDGGSSSSSKTTWNAPWQVKATFGVYILWAVCFWVQLFYLAKRIQNIPLWKERIPYLILLLVTGLIATGYVLSVFWEKASTGTDWERLNSLNTSITLLFSFSYSFHAGVVLYIAQQRAAFLRKTQRNSIYPLACKMWKRCFDWVLVAIMFSLQLAKLGVLAVEAKKIEKDELTDAERAGIAKTLDNLSYATGGTAVILAIHVLITLISVLQEQKRCYISDRVIHYLLWGAFPFMALYAIEWLAVDIYTTTIPSQGKVNKLLTLWLAEAIMEGVFRLGITAAILLTLTASNVQWSGSAVVILPHSQAPIQERPYKGPSDYAPIHHPAPFGYGGGDAPVQQPYEDSQPTLHHHYNPPFQPPQQPYEPPSHPPPKMLIFIPVNNRQ